MQNLPPVSGPAVTSLFFFAVLITIIIILIKKKYGIPLIIFGGIISVPCIVLFTLSLNAIFNYHGTGMIREDEIFSNLFVFGLWFIIGAIQLIIGIIITSKKTKTKGPQSNSDS